MSDLPIKVLSRDEVKKLADNAYCEYVRIMGTYPCLGFEAKIKAGEFGQRELDAHRDAAIQLGKHRAYSEILRMMDAYEEPAPKWEPGMVLKCVDQGCCELRLDECLPDKNTDHPDWQRWKFLDFENGKFTTGWLNPAEMHVHRLPHEFKEGDWFECSMNFCDGGQVAKIDGDYIVDQDGEHHLASDAFHVPAPKEAKPECEDVDEAEVANETSKELLGHGTRPDPFQGKHWDSLDEKIAEIEKRKTGLGIGPTYYPFLRQRDLRDEVRRLRGEK